MIWSNNCLLCQIQLDSFPYEDQLPALVYKNVVGLTLDQVDNITYLQYFSDECEISKELYKKYFIEAMNDVDSLKSIVEDLKVNKAKQDSKIVRLEAINNDELLAAWNFSKTLERDLRKAKQQKTFLTVGGSVIIGALVAIILTK